MRSIFLNYLSGVVLRRFFQIVLTKRERELAELAVTDKYLPALKTSFFSALLFLPAILLLDVSAIFTMLIPITMVAGTAWYAVSLASLKKKFEKFGLELTINLFSAFLISLCLLLLMAVSALTKEFWQPYVLQLPYLPLFKVFSVFLGIVVVFMVIYYIFLGSLKFDINDSMLTGQDEAAEKYFRKALSKLYAVSLELRGPQPGPQANYLIGLFFEEIFFRINEVEGLVVQHQDVEMAKSLTQAPTIDIADADEVAVRLIRRFLGYCNLGDLDAESERIVDNMRAEIQIIMSNIQKKKEVTSNAELEVNIEGQHMIDWRLSVIFEGIAYLLDEYGEALFSGVNIEVS